MIQEFVDVFPESIPGLPQKREIGFTIELIQVEDPVSKSHYHMRIIELTKLKMKL